MTDARLEIRFNHQHAETHHLREGTYTIGREQGEIILADRSVSARHARIEVRGDRVTIEDLGSRNGTIDRHQQKLQGICTLHLGEPVSIGRYTVTLTPRVSFEPLAAPLPATVVAPPAGKGTAHGESDEQRSVFISHSSKDAVQALMIARELESARYSTWCFELETTGGGQHTEQTTLALRHADSMVLLISPKAIDSHWVSHELFHAKEARKPVIPMFCGITREQVIQRRLEWVESLGTVVSLEYHDLAVVRPRLLAALQQLRVPLTRSSEASRTRLQRIAADLQGRGHSTRPQKLRLAVSGRVSPSDGAQAKVFPGAAGRVEEVCAHLQAMLEREGLEVQVLAQGELRILQARTAANQLRFGLGLERAVTATLEPQQYNLLLEVGEGQWLDKALGGMLGFFVFPPAALTAGWGAYKQKELLSQVQDEVARILGTQPGSNLRA